MVQAKLKNDFVARGLMLGQFHPHCDEPGLWNDDFRPLRSPVPLLGIRHMVPTDFPFWKNDKTLFARYLERFREDVPPRILKAVRSCALRFGLAPPDQPK